MTRPRSQAVKWRATPSRSSLLAMVVGLLIGTSLVAWSIWSPGSSTAARLSYAVCTEMDSNNTLATGVLHLYQGNGNASGPGAGLIDRTPPGRGAYPSESVADGNVINGWRSICESQPFAALIQQWGPQTNPWNGLAQNSSGIYEFVFTVNWPAPASSCPTLPSPTNACTGTAEWLVNVASGNVSGPSTTYWTARPAV
jgi:hypothetical protein